MKPQGKTLFLLELMHTELKTVWRCSCQEFWTAAAVCNHWPFLIILFTPIASRSCFPDLPFPAAAEQSRAWELCWAEECCLPVSKAGFPAQTCTTEHLTLLGRKLNKNDGFENLCLKAGTVQLCDPECTARPLPGEHRRDFCPWCLSGGWAAGARGCPGGELCSALHTRLPEPVPSLASERAPLILERIWSLWSKQWVKQAVFWSVFSKGLLPSSGIPQTLSLALFLKWNYGLLCGFVQGSLLTGLSGVISSLFMDEAKHKANWKSCISTWTVHKQKDGASWWWWLMQWGCWGNPHHWMTLQKVRRGDSSV